MFSEVISGHLLGLATNLTDHDDTGGGWVVVDCFVGQRTRSRHDTDLTLLVNMSWHNTDFAATRLDNTWTVWSNKSSFFLLDKGVLHTDHVLLWDTLGNASYKWDFGFNSLQNGGSSQRWWNVNNGGICALFHGLSDCTENWSIQMRTARLAWVRTAHDVSSVLDGHLRMKGTLLTGETLNYELRMVTNHQIWSSLVVTASVTHASS